MPAGFVKQMGNIEFLILSIGGVVFFTLLLVTGNTMAIAVRERTRELAVLKAVGFSDRFVLGLVVAESLIVAFVGGGLGLALCKLFTLGGDPTGGLLPFFYLPSQAIALGVARRCWWDWWQRHFRDGTPCACAWWMPCGGCEWQFP